MTKTHGMSHLPEYKVWKGMIQRCEYKKHIRYAKYGARGIKVCPRWRKSFVNFYNDMGPRPSKNHTVERLNNNEGYKPSNCVWLLKKFQPKNRTDTIFVKFEGKTKCITDWADEFKIPRGIVYQRYYNGARGIELFKPSKRRQITFEGKTKSLTEWARMLKVSYETLSKRLDVFSIEEAFSKPSGYRSTDLTFRGKTQSATKWAEELNVTASVIRTRLHRGWSVKRALTTP